MTPGSVCSSFHPGACLAWWCRPQGGLRLPSHVAPAGYGTVWSISPVIAWAPQPGAQQRAVRARNTDRPPARYLWFRPFSGGLRSEPDGHLSAHPALWRLWRAGGWFPVMDRLVAGCADDERLAP